METKKKRASELKAGDRFSKLVVVSVFRNEKNRIVASCKCDCGNVKVIDVRHLLSGATQSCGCFHRKEVSKLWKKSVEKTMGHFKSLIGKRFGSLLVIGDAEPMTRRDGRREGMSICRCDCGKEVVIRNCSLVTGYSKSCGCVKNAKTIERNKKRAITGQSGSRLYRIFTNMHDRCENPMSQAFRNYGLKGISVCSEWEKFEPFYKWAIGNGYADNLTIDRIDSALGYSPNNCRWVTMKENIRNKDSVIRVEYNGRKWTLGELVEKFGNISLNTLRSRIHSGWGVEDALTIPINKGNGHKRIGNKK